MKYAKDEEGMKGEKVSANEVATDLVLDGLKEKGYLE